MNTNSCCTLSSERAASGPPWLVLSVLLLAGFMTIFDLFVVNVAIPSIQTGMGANFSQIGFIVAGYELAFGVLLITGGRLGDRFGRRKLFIVGMACFILSSVLCGLAPGAGFFDRSAGVARLVRRLVVSSGLCIHPCQFQRG